MLLALVDSQLCPPSSATAAAAAAGWREAHLLVLQALLDARAECVVAQLPRLVAAMAAATDGPLGANPKLCQGFTALAAGFGAALGAGQLARLAEAAGRTNTFMTKGLLARLRQLAQAAARGEDGA
jgi:hypothetical protein